MAEELTKKKRSRGGHISAFKRYVNYLQLIYDDFHVEQADDLTSTYEILLQKSRKISALEEEITMLVDVDSIEEEILEHAVFEKYVNMELRKLKKFIDNMLKEADDVSTVSATSSRMTNDQQIKLPKIELKKFSGDPLNWRTFLDSLECAVDKNIHLSSVEKMNYLVNLMTGPAEQTLAGLSLCNDNYEIALDLLKKRYGD